MNLPKDWTRKPDWLERQKSGDSWFEDVKMTLGFVVPAVLLLGGLGWFLYALLKYSGNF